MKKILVLLICLMLGVSTAFAGQTGKALSQESIIEKIHTFEAVSLARESSIADAKIKTFTKKRIILNEVLLEVLSLTEA